jgi:transcriptional regulator with XRE-family HTH domain
MKTLSEIISNYMFENKLSQREFAKLASISHTYVAKLQTGIDPRTGKQIEPTLDVIEKLANAMQISLYELFIELGKFEEANSPAIKRRTVVSYDKATDTYKYFNPIEYDKMSTDENSNNLTKKDEKDVEKLLNQTMNYIENQEGIMLNGEILDENDLLLLKQAIKNGLEIAKISNKKKFTPKKYRKDKE